MDVIRGGRPSHDSRRKLVPEKITLMYRNLFDTHTFTAQEVPGLVVMHHDPRRAYDMAVDGAGELVSAISGTEVRYDAEIGFDELKRRVDRQVGIVKKKPLPDLASLDSPRTNDLF